MDPGRAQKPKYYYFVPVLLTQRYSHWDMPRDNPSDVPRRSQYYDQGRSQDDHQWRLRVRGDSQGDKRVDFDGPFEDAMKGLASHAAKFLKNASRRDRALVETAVWKAYGDSIASLGYKNNTGRADNRTREWVSARGINNRSRGNPALRAPS